MSRREEEGGEQKGRRSKTRQKTYNKLNILRGVVRGVPFRGVAWKNVTKTLRGAVLCNPGRGPVTEMKMLSQAGHSPSLWTWMMRCLAPI